MFLKAGLDPVDPKNCLAYRGNCPTDIIIGKYEGHLSHRQVVKAQAVLAASVRSSRPRSCPRPTGSTFTSAAPPARPAATNWTRRQCAALLMARSSVR